MGKNICSICNNKIGLLDNKYKIANEEVICLDCLNKAGALNQVSSIKNMNSNDIKKQIKILAENEEKMKEKVKNFKTTKQIGQYLYIDEEKQQWAIRQGVFSKKIETIYDYSDIIDFELLENGNSISKGGLGRAVAGGLLFGGVGAIVGGVTGGKKSKKTCTNLKIKITLNDLKNPVRYINFISTEVKKSSALYSTSYSMAQEIISMLQIMCETQKVKSIQSNQEIIKTSETISVADEIKKFKDLLDIGVITQEEFEYKKKELLNL